MIQATKFTVDPRWRLMLKDIGISENEVLNRICASNFRSHPEIERKNDWTAGCGSQVDHLWFCAFLVGYSNIYRSNFSSGTVLLPHWLGTRLWFSFPGSDCLCDVSIAVPCLHSLSRNKNRLKCHRKKGQSCNLFSFNRS